MYLETNRGLGAPIHGDQELGDEPNADLWRFFHPPPFSKLKLTIGCYGREQNPIVIPGLDNASEIL